MKAITITPNNHDEPKIQPPKAPEKNLSKKPNYDTYVSETLRSIHDKEELSIETQHTHSNLSEIIHPIKTFVRFNLNFVILSHLN